MTEYRLATCEDCIRHDLCVEIEAVGGKTDYPFGAATCCPHFIYDEEKEARS